MLKKICMMATTLFLLLGAPDFARSDVTGDWDVVGTVKLTVTSRGRTVTLKQSFVDHFIFNSDGTFEMTGLDGTWSQPKAKFKVLLDPLEVDIYFEQAAANLGYDISADVRSVRFKGKERQDGTIKGAIVVNMGVVLHDFGNRRGTLIANVNFTGAPSTTSLAVPLDQSPARSSTGDSFLEVLNETVVSFLVAE